MIWLSATMVLLFIVSEHLRTRVRHVDYYSSVHLFSHPGLGPERNRHNSASVRKFSASCQPWVTLLNQLVDVADYSLGHPPSRNSKSFYFRAFSYYFWQDKSSSGMFCLTLQPSTSVTHALSNVSNIAIFWHKHVRPHDYKMGSIVQVLLPQSRVPSSNTSKNN